MTPTPKKYLKNISTFVFISLLASAQVINNLSFEIQTNLQNINLWKLESAREKDRKWVNFKNFISCSLVWCVSYPFPTYVTWRELWIIYWLQPTYIRCNTYMELETIKIDIVNHVPVISKISNQFWTVRVNEWKLKCEKVVRCGYYRIIRQR